MAGKTEYKNNYNYDNYKRIPLMLKKEGAEVLKQIAEEHGESVNGYIKEAIKQRAEAEDKKTLEL